MAAVTDPTSGPHHARQARARAAMAARGVDALLLSVGSDLPYLTGYEAMPLERLTMLVLPRDGEAVLVVPELEAPRVEADAGGCTVRAWPETADPVAIVADLVGDRAGTVAIGDQTWARFVLALQAALPGTTFTAASAVTGPLRMVKDAAEVEALRAAAHAVDAVAAEMRTRPFAGRTELDVQRELVDRILDHGHQRANFAIVGSGPNGASPHHDAADRVIRAGDVVVCDFGGTRAGYCSDITRMFVVGDPPPEVVDTYGALAEAQEEAVRAAVVGESCAEVDAVARRALSRHGLAEHFVHRVGHGIGLDAHEDPYLVAGNAQPLAPGHAFSIEPGVYFPGRFGMRIEDIVVAAESGPDRLNRAPRDLAIVG
jgi:Xaa-Pro aminopeptidase